MSADILLERDMLYPTSNSIEPGSINIRVFGPDQDARIPVVVESKSGHSPLKNLDTIVRIMQSDIFDRIFINVKKTVDIYIKNELPEEYGDHVYIRVRYKDDGMECIGADR
jgi:hypothetical protein